MNFKKASILFTLLYFNLLVYSVPVKENNVGEISIKNGDSSVNGYDIRMNNSPLEEEEELTDLSDNDEIIEVTDSFIY